MNKKSLLIHPAFAILTLAASVLACSMPGQVTETPPTATVESSPTPEPSLVGTWVNDNGVTTIAFDFNAEGGYAMYMDGTEVARGQYSTLDTITPPGITLIRDDSTVIYAIYEFLSPDVLRLENNFPGNPRPSSFSDYLDFLRTGP